MNKILSISTFLIFILAILNGTGVSAEEPSNWAEWEVSYLQDSTSIKEEIYQDYKKPITRGEFSYLIVKILEDKNLVQNEELETSISFNDTKNYYHLKSAQLGIVKGYPDNTFRSENKITREEIGVMLNRVMKKYNKSIDPKELHNVIFKDHSKISHWAKNDVTELYQTGLIRGVGELEYGPKSDTTKEQGLVLIRRLMTTLDQKAIKPADYLYTNTVSELPILMYHHISTDPKLWNPAIISPEKFREDMLYIKAMGYNTVSVKELVDYKEKGTPLPHNPILITFDDGYYSNYQYAYPVLKELNMKAVIGVIGWSVGREYTLDNSRKISPHFTWEEAQEMIDSGLIEIQNHTYDLHNLPVKGVNGKGVLPYEGETTSQHANRFKKDTLKLHNMIEDKLNHEQQLFTYPFGVYNSTTEKVLKELGYKMTLTTKDGLASIRNNLYELRRVNMPHDTSSAELMKKITRLEGKYVEIPFKNTYGQTKRINQLEYFLGL